ncbi:MATE efflux family protein [Neoconidiobolus thromboides FSU 785]|nr:MATE efflux family protein [Neoconidiobolus thromboides FSU 785]
MDIEPSDITFKRVVNESYLLSKLAIPIVISYVLQNIIPLASVYSLGHLGPTELAASALSNMFASVTGWSVAMGMATALDTLCSQAFTGARNLHIVGIYLQRGILISLTLLIPVSFLWLYAENILLLLKQDPELAYYCGRYLKILLLGAPPYIVFECLKKFLQAQDIMTAATYILFSVIPINVVLNFLLVFYEPTRLGFDGAPLTVALTNWCMMIFAIIYIRLFKGYQAWGGWTKESLDGWYEFLKLGIPGIIMVCAEWWAFEVMGLAASYLGKAPLAAHAVSLTTCNLFYMVPLGLSIAASNRMGNLLGDATSNRAKLCGLAALLLALLFSMINSTILVVFRDFWGYLFTDDESVALLAKSILPIAALFQVFDGLSGVSGGLLRGQGRQKLGAIVNVIAYYGLSLPIGFYLAFGLGWGVYGLWWGLAIALFLCALTLVSAILYTNWEEEVFNCQERLRQEEMDRMNGPEIV